MSEQTVQYEYADSIARIHLNRPHRLNAVVPALQIELTAAIQRAYAEEARVIILAGRGRAFCSGYDLKEPDPVETPAQTRARVEQIQDIARAVRAFPGIVIAAVHGYALGAGCEFALGCDLVVASEDAMFGFPEVGVGLSVTGGISKLLPMLVGPLRAKELLLLGERINADDAAAMGLINRVVSKGEHETEALRLAQHICTRPAEATTFAKLVLDRGIDSTFDAALATEVDHALMTKHTNEANVFGA